MKLASSSSTIPSMVRKPASAICVATAVGMENVSASSLMASAFWSSKDAVAIDFLISMCQPVSFVVRRTFCPRLPIAFW